MALSVAKQHKRLKGVIARVRLAQGTPKSGVS